MNQEINKEFLFKDENVKYKLTNHDDQVTVVSEHPIFINRFHGNTVTKSLQEFNDVSHKGSDDYDFFEKLKLSLQEHFLSVGS